MGVHSLTSRVGKLQRRTLPRPTENDALIMDASAIANEMFTLECTCRILPDFTVVERRLRFLLEQLVQIGWNVIFVLDGTAPLDKTFTTLARFVLL